MLRRSRTAGAAAALAAVAMLATTPASAAPAPSNDAVERKAKSATVTTQLSAGRSTLFYEVRNARCWSNAITFTGETLETGRSGVQQFQQRAILQEFVGGRWVRRAGKTITSNRFPNDWRNTSFTLDWRGSHVANGRPWREIWQGFYYDGFGFEVGRTPRIFVTC